MTLQDVIAAALRHVEVADALAPALTSELVVASIFERRICEFLSEFVDSYGTLPKAGDWTAWLDELPDRERDGVRGRLRELQARDLSGYTPDFITAHAGPVLRNAAARSAVSRLNRVADEGAAEALTRLADEIARVDVQARPDLDLILMGDVRPESVRWLWPGRIPLGKVTILDGDPGLGKSTVALDLAARLSTGAEMPDGAQPQLDAPRGTVVLSAEDGLADTIRPRLNVAGADPGRIAVLRAVGTGDDARPPTVNDLGEIEAAIRAVDARLLVLDPLVAYLGRGVDSHRDADVRGALAGLADLADECRIAVLAIRHLNKSGGANPLYRGGGSIGLIAAARSGLLIAANPDDPHGDRRILAPTKANLAAPARPMAYYLESVGGAARVSWAGEVEKGAADLLETTTREQRTDREEASVFLRGELRDGERPVSEIRDAAEELGLTWSTVQAAKALLGVESVKEGFGKDGRWLWRLSDPADGAHEPAGPAAKAEQTRESSILGDESSDSPRPSRTKPKIDGESTLAPKIDSPSNLANVPTVPGESESSGPKIEEIRRTGALAGKKGEGSP